MSEEVVSGGIANPATMKTPLCKGFDFPTVLCGKCDLNISVSQKRNVSVRFREVQKYIDAALGLLSAGEHVSEVRLIGAFPERYAAKFAIVALKKLHRKYPDLPFKLNGGVWTLYPKVV